MTARSDTEVPKYQSDNAKAQLLAGEAPLSLLDSSLLPRPEPEPRRAWGSGFRRFPLRLVREGRSLPPPVVAVVADFPYLFFQKRKPRLQLPVFGCRFLCALAFAFLRCEQRRVNPVQFGGIDLVAPYLILFGRNTPFFDRFGNGGFRHSGCFSGGSQGVHRGFPSFDFPRSDSQPGGDGCQGAGRAVGNEGRDGIGRTGSASAEP